MNDTSTVYLVYYKDDDLYVVTSVSYPKGFNSYPEVSLSPRLEDAQPFSFKEACRHYARIPARIKASYELWDEEDMYAERVIQGKEPSMWFYIIGFAAIIGLVIAIISTIE